ALWFYLYRTYGQRKVMDLLYLARLTRNVSEAFYLTLNLSPEEITQKWLGFIRSLQEKDTLASEAVEISRRALLNAAVSMEGEKQAYAFLQEGKVRYALATEKGLVELPGSWPWRTAYYDPEVPMSFSSSGQLAWVSYERDGVIMWYWGPTENSYKRFSLPLRSIQSLSWQNESVLLLAGMNDRGEVKGYTFSITQGTLSELPKAEGDLLFPIWMQGKYYAVWQPDTGAFQFYSVLWEPGCPVVYEGNQWVPLALPPFYSLGGGWIRLDTSWVSIADVTGEGHPWIFWQDTSAPSSWGVHGLHSWVGQGREKAYFLRYRAGRLRLGAVPIAKLRQPGAVFPSLSAAEVVQFRLQRKASYLGTYRTTRLIPSPTKPDTSTDSLRESHRPFYLFDEEVSRPSRRKRIRPPEKPSRDSFLVPSIKPAGMVPYHWLLWELQMEPVLHPLMRLGWQVQATIRDWQADHEWKFLWTPYIDLRSSELQLSYTRYRSRWQPLVQLTKQSHFFPARRYQVSLRNNTWHGKIGLRYILSSTLALEGAALGMHFSRYDMQNTDDQDLSASGNWLGGVLSLSYSQLIQRERFTWKGWKAMLRIEGYREKDNWRFPLIMMQMERFQPVGQRMVVHMRGLGAAGGNKGRFFLLGGVPDWVNYEFENRNQIPLLGGMGSYYLNEYVFLPGFPYHARRGKYLLLSSVVLRMPLFAWRKVPSLPTRPIYNFEWQVGYNLATTWTTGNPFSQKNPIDAEYIYRPPLVISVQAFKSPFLMSVGTGVRFYIMRLPIGLEVYWPIEESRIGTVRFLASLKREF
ncbi:MAG: hypothetical protein RMJ66_03560, partial [Bacteroidia bacterium]|nr:hypothetical protein [Bacteroidia bacterium]MDW8134124.1 hypothetical protein [Bacteroidia bacterium]